MSPVDTALHDYFFVSCLDFLNWSIKTLVKILY